MSAIIKFNPLRRIKKTGKITVASYMQWRKIKNADYVDLTLILNDEYKNFPKNEFVYNHKGENLFWRNYNPEDIQMLNRYDLVDGEQPKYPKMWVTDYGMYSAKGLDVDGVPTFSHFTANSIYNSNADMENFEPLTVEVVNWWFGWFIYNLNNTKISYK